MNYYYLKDNRIWMANDKMPLDTPTDKIELSYDMKLKYWKDSLKPCEISGSELEKVITELNITRIFYPRKDEILEVTDIITVGRGPLSGILYFKQPKQVEEIEAVESQEEMIKDIISMYKEALTNGLLIENIKQQFTITRNI